VRELQRQLDAVFERYDFILTPATAALPWPCDQSHPSEIGGLAVGPRGHAVFTAFANAAGLPAIALPSAIVDGLPAGFQLVAASGRDAELMALALQYESAFPWGHMWSSVQGSTGT
jgi:aspartyl-tRNA(Asn)/glutamyl-tRNA(Gln) amidotransferase subunit A